MHVLCIQSILASIPPFDLGFVGIPSFVWIRDALTWFRQVAIAGGARAAVSSVLLLALKLPPSAAPDRLRGSPSRSAGEVKRERQASLVGLCKGSESEPRGTPRI